MSIFKGFWWFGRSPSNVGSQNPFTLKCFKKLKLLLFNSGWLLNDLEIYFALFCFLVIDINAGWNCFDIYRNTFLLSTVWCVFLLFFIFNRNLAIVRFFWWFSPSIHVYTAIKCPKIFNLFRLNLKDKYTRGGET